jgi:hypothetical protein
MIERSEVEDGLPGTSHTDKRHNVTGFYSHCAPVAAAANFQCSAKAARLANWFWESPEAGWQEILVTEFVDSVAGKILRAVAIEILQGDLVLILGPLCRG